MADRQADTEHFNNSGAGIPEPTGVNQERICPPGSARSAPAPEQEQSDGLHQQALDCHEKAWDFMREVERREGIDSDLYQPARDSMLAANRCIGLALAADKAAKKGRRS